MFRVRCRVMVSVRVYVWARIRARLKEPLKRLTLGVLHAFDGHLYVSG